MWRISSPGEYSLCSANSTDAPCSRAWCMPVIAPSTITRARIGNVPSRATVCGSRKGTARLGHDGAEQAIDQVAGAHALGLGAVVEDEAMLQGRARERGDVVD